MSVRDYRLHELHSETEFEKLVHLIAKEFLGITHRFKQGRDGGRDGRFSGRAECWPSSPGLEGKFVLQAKHTRSTTSDCSASYFLELVRKEKPKIEKLVRDGECDYYLFFTAWNLPGPVDYQLIREIEDIGVKKAAIFAGETLQDLISQNEYIENWVFQRTGEGRAKSSQQWRHFQAVLNEQRARTCNLVGFMNEALSLEYVNIDIDKLLQPTFVQIEGGGALSNSIDMFGMSHILKGQATTYTVEGPTGAGKSVAAKMLVQRRLAEFESDQARYGDSAFWLPYYISGTKIEQDWDKFIEDIENRLLKTNHTNWRILVDGFDEIKNDEVRRQLLSYAESNQSNSGFALLFVFFTRPNVISDADLSVHRRFAISKLTRENVLDIIEFFSGSEARPEDFVKNLESVFNKEVLSRPLFIALASYSAAVEGRNPRSQFDMIYIFIEDVLKRAEAKYGLNENQLYEDLIALVKNKKTDPSPPKHRGAEAIRARRKIERAIASSGIATISESRLMFSHEIFSYYFTAQGLARNHSPSTTIWEEIDPFEVGWETVSLLCETWDSEGRDINGCIEALARMGDDGFRVAVGLATTCCIDEKILCDFVQKLFDRYKEEDFLLVDEGMISSIASRSEQIRRYLNYVAVSNDHGISDAPVLAARCIASFDEARAIELLNEIASDCEHYFGDRLHAAEYLAKIGVEDLAIEAFRALSYESCDFWGRIDAAISALELTGDENDRLRLDELVSKESPDEELDGETLLRLARLGPSKFALAKLREAVEKVSLRKEANVEAISFIDFRRALESCEALASLGRGDEAVAYYECLLKLEKYRSRHIAEILESMTKSGFDAEVSARLQDSQLLSRLRSEPDWLSAAFLADHGYHDISIEDAMASFRSSITARGGLSEPSHYADRLISGGKQDEVAEIILELPELACRPCHFEVLARCGRRRVAKEKLLVARRNWSNEEQIEAAEILEAIGFHDAAVAKLTEAAVNKDLSVEDRTKAALAAFELDNDRISLVEQCIEDSNEDKLLQAKVARKLLNIKGVPSELVWDHLIPQLWKKAIPVNCQVEYMSALFNSDANGVFETGYDDLIDEIHLFLRNISDPRLLAKCIVEFRAPDDHWGFEEQILERLCSEPELWAVDVITPICRRNRLRNALQLQILNFTNSLDCDLETEIAVLRQFAFADNDSGARERLTKIAMNSNIPSNWRLAAVGVRRNLSKNALSDIDWQSRRTKVSGQDDPAEIRLCRLIGSDTSLTVECRLAALESLGDGCVAADVSDLLDSFTNCAYHTRISLAAHLADRSSSEQAADVLDAVLATPRLPLHVLPQLFELSKKLELADVELQLCKAVSALDDIVIEWAEEFDPLYDATVRMRQTLGPQSTAEFVNRLIAAGNWSSEEHTRLCAALIASTPDAALPVPPKDEHPSYIVDEQRANWLAFYEAEKQFDRGDFSQASALKELLGSPGSPLGVCIRAVGLLHRLPESEFSDELLEKSLSRLQALAIGGCESVSDLLALAERLVETKKCSKLQPIVERLIEIELNTSQQISLSKVLDKASMPTAAADELIKVGKLNGYIGPSDLSYLDENLGRSELMRIILNTFNDNGGDLIEKIDLAAEVVSKFGSKTALRFLSDTARSADLVSCELLRLAECFYELGFFERSLALFERALFASGPDYFWLADFCLWKLGRNDLAEELMVKNLGSFRGNYFDQAMRLLADLQLDGAMRRLEDLESAANKGDVVD